MADVPLNILRSEVTITIGHNHFTVTKFLKRSVLDNRIDKKLVMFSGKQIRISLRLRLPIFLTGTPFDLGLEAVRMFMLKNLGDSLDF